MTICDDAANMPIHPAVRAEMAAAQDANKIPLSNRTPVRDPLNTRIPMTPGQRVDIKKLQREAATRIGLTNVLSKSQKSGNIPVSQLRGRLLTKRPGGFDREFLSLRTPKDVELVSNVPEWKKLAALSAESEGYGQLKQAELVEEAIVPRWEEGSLDIPNTEYISRKEWDKLVTAKIKNDPGFQEDFKEFAKEFAEKFPGKEMDKAIARRVTRILTDQDWSKAWGKDLPPKPLLVREIAALRKGEVRSLFPDEKAKLEKEGLLDASKSDYLVGKVGPSKKDPMPTALARSVIPMKNGVGEDFVVTGSTYLNTPYNWTRKAGGDASYPQEMVVAAQDLMDDALRKYDPTKTTVEKWLDTYYNKSNVKQELFRALNQIVPTKGGPFLSPNAPVEVRSATGGQLFKGVMTRNEMVTMGKQNQDARFYIEGNRVDAKKRPIIERDYDALNPKVDDGSEFVAATYDTRLNSGNAPSAEQRFMDAQGGYQKALVVERVFAGAKITPAERELLLRPTKGLNPEQKEAKEAALRRVNTGIKKEDDRLALRGEGSIQEFIEQGGTRSLVNFNGETGATIIDAALIKKGTVFDMPKPDLFKAYNLSGISPGELDLVLRKPSSFSSGSKYLAHYKALKPKGLDDLIAKRSRAIKALIAAIPPNNAPYKPGLLAEPVYDKGKITPEDMKRFEANQAARIKKATALEAIRLGPERARRGGR